MKTKENIPEVLSDKREDDIENIEIIGLDEFDKEYFHSISEEGRDEWKAIGMENCNNQKYYTVIGENNVKLGIVGIYDIESEKNITHIVIDPKFRGRGLLPKFYEHLIQKEDLSFLVATIKTDNMASVKSHEKAGFEKISDEKYEMEFQKYKYMYTKK